MAFERQQCRMPDLARTVVVSKLGEGVGNNRDRHPASQFGSSFPLGNDTLHALGKQLRNDRGIKPPQGAPGGTPQGIPFRSGPPP